MLISYLKDVSISYDGINVSHERIGNEKEVSNPVGNALVSSARAKLVIANKSIEKEDKKIKGYEDKKVKTYENKSIAPKRTIKKKETRK